MEILKLILLICAMNTNGPSKCFEEQISVYQTNHTKAISAKHNVAFLCMKAAMPILTAKRLQFYGTPYKVIKWKCVDPRKEV